METATIFVVGFVNHIPKGALLLVSDNPMTPEGVKTSLSDAEVTEQFVRKHLEVGIDTLIELRDSGVSVKHMRFEERPSRSKGIDAAPRTRTFSPRIIRVMWMISWAWPRKWAMQRTTASMPFRS